ncbi:type II secretion system F family protein [Stieleria sp. JC731]|uniref:type II secretion system F family protein n=1 Tax=Stieleria sp. JC731 TaxID=2894195 RepID=UPI001E3B37AB|nr:type II secretion system F family protein [Stieleria sp. JC731]MCC9600901.1 type II secretion system F family protein [Stieleria sp. JC731]
MIATFPAAIVLSLFAGTLRTLKGNLIHRPAEDARTKLANCIGLFEGFLWFASVVCVILAAPHPVSVILVLMVVASVISAFGLRYQEEKQSLNRWIKITAQCDTPFPRLLDHFANGCHSSIARKAKNCAFRLLRGDDLLQTIRRSKLPLDPDAVAMMRRNVSRSMEAAESDQRVVRPHSVEQELAMNQSLVRRRQQLVYVVVTIMLCVLFSATTRTFTFPTISAVSDEFSVEPAWSDNTFEQVELAEKVCLTAIVIILFVVLCARWLPKQIVRMIPWFGKSIIDRNRTELIESIGLGLRAGYAENDILLSSTKTNRNRWIRRASRRIGNRIDQGLSLVDALYRSKIITTRERVWLTSAEKNGTLPEAMSQLKSDVFRRQTYRWNLRMSWFVPLVTCVVGGYIFFYAWYVFHFLTRIVEVIPQ